MDGLQQSATIAIDHHQEQRLDQPERREIEKHKMRLDFFFLVFLFESLVDTVCVMGSMRVHSGVFVVREKRVNSRKLKRKIEGKYYEAMPTNRTAGGNRMAGRCKKLLNADRRTRCSTTGFV